MNCRPIAPLLPVAPRGSARPAGSSSERYTRLPVRGRDLGTTALQIVTSTCIAVPPQRGKRLTNGNPILKAVNEPLSH
jgi:hypothetical protein